MSEGSPQSADARFIRWLTEHQNEAGVFTTVSTLVDTLSDWHAAQEILEHVQRAQQQERSAA